MDVMGILALVEKGLSVASTLIDVGKSAAPAIKVVTDLVTGAQTGEVTDEQLDATEAALDKLIADFNLPL